jgi:hypothetical protein
MPPVAIELGQLVHPFVSINSGLRMAIAKEAARNPRGPTIPAQTALRGGISGS